MGREAQSDSNEHALIRPACHAGSVELFGGASLGGIVGVVIAELVRRHQRPRLKFVGLESTKPERGLAGGGQYLRRIKFEVKGSSAGSATSIQLRWGPGPRQATYVSGTRRRSRWRRTQSRESGKSPNLVPASFFLPLYADERYTVPILIDWDTSRGIQPGAMRVLDVFCGRWYIEHRPGPTRLRVRPATRSRSRFRECHGWSAGFGLGRLRGSSRWLSSRMDPCDTTRRRSVAALSSPHGGSAKDQASNHSWS